jgi:thioredoxin reductase (NADPH)
MPENNDFDVVILVTGPAWQMAKAVGEGCVAGIGVASYAKKLRKQQQTQYEH